MTASRTLKLALLSFIAAQVISIFGDRLHQFSVVGMIGKMTPGSSLELFQFSLFIHLPAFFFAPILGSIIDRSNKVMVLIVVDIFRGILVLGIPALFYKMNNLYAFYLPVFFLSLANLLFSPAKSAVLPELFGTVKLLKINSILWAVGIIGTLAGFLVGGWLLDFHTWEMSFYCDGASYLISVLFLLPLLAVPRTVKTAPGEPSPHPNRAGTWAFSGLFASVRDGLATIRGNRVIATSLIAQTILFGSFGVLYIIGVGLIQTVFPPERTTYLSAIATSAMLGLLAGSFLATALKDKLPTNRHIAAAAVLYGAAWTTFAATSDLVVVLISGFMIGAGVSPIFVMTETLLQVHTPDRFRGRVFAARDVTTKAAFLVATSLAVLLTTFIGKAAILVVIGVLLALMGVILERYKFLRV